MSTYQSSTRRTISLAEQLESGQIVFELWAKVVDPKSQSSLNLLLGTCTVQLEALLENRIGIRGWLSIGVPEPSSKSVGGLEIVIRFTKHDDFLKVINAGEDIGWVKGGRLGSKKPNCEIPLDKMLEPSGKDLDSSPINELSTQLSANNPKHAGIKCSIEIEKAAHLPSVHHTQAGRRVPPNAFVTLNPNLSKPSEIVETGAVEKNSSPTWNYQLITSLDADFFLDEQKYFILKVWHKDFTEKSGNKILGYASIDLTPLICGLSHINGWYNIQDSVENCQGQIKVNIVPQENLFALKQLYHQRKKTQTSCESRTSLSNLRIESSLSNFGSKSPETDTDVSSIKQGLMEKLNELDQMNKALKERLENKKEPKQENSGADMKPFDKEIAETRPEVKLNVKVVVNESKEIKAMEQFQDAKNMFVQDLEAEKICDQVKKEKNKVFIEEVGDSFWASDSEKKLEKIAKEPEPRELLFEVKHLPPSGPCEIKGEKLEQVLDANDTDLDQTLNLNASYEIVPIRANSSGSTSESYDIVDRVIDCSKAEDEYEELNEDKKEEANNSDNEHHENFFEEMNPEENEENVTIVIPEELNKIDQLSHQLESKTEAKNNEELEIKVCSLKILFLPF